MSKKPCCKECDQVPGLTTEEENAFDNFVAEILRGVGKVNEEKEDKQDEDEDPEADTDFDDKKDEAEDDDWENESEDEVDEKAYYDGEDFRSEEKNFKIKEEDDDEVDEEDDYEVDESHTKKGKFINESCEDDKCDEEDDEVDEEDDEEKSTDEEDDEEKSESCEDDKCDEEDDEVDEEDDEEKSTDEEDDEEKSESCEDDKCDEEDEEGDKVDEGEFVEPQYQKDAMDDAMKLAVAWRKSEAGKKCLAKWGKLLVAAGWKVNESVIARSKKVTEQRTRAITESLNESIAKSPLFKSLNESEGKQLKEAFLNGVQKTVAKSSELVRKDVIKECESYVNSKLIPSMASRLDEYTKDQVVPTLHEQIDNYMKYAAKSVVNEMADQKLIVKSRQTKQLEDVVESIKSVLESKLKVIPESENILDALESENASLTESMDALRMKNIQRKDTIIRLKKENYFLKNKPAGLSEAGEEKLKAKVMAIDESEFKSFKSKASKLMKESAETITESVKKKDSGVRTEYNYVADLVERTLNLGK